MEAHCASALQDWLNEGAEGTIYFSLFWQCLNAYFLLCFLNLIFWIVLLCFIASFGLLPPFKVPLLTTLSFTDKLLNQTNLF